MRSACIWISRLVIVALSGTLAIAQSSQPAAVAVDTSTPKGALKSLAVAMDAGDAAAIRSLLQATSPSEQKMVGAMSELAANIAAMNKAVIVRFGRDKALKALGGDPAEMLKQSLSTIDAAAERIEGDSALVSTPAKESMTLKKVEGGWKVSMADLSKGSTPAAVDERVAELSRQMKAMREVTAEMTAGAFKDADEALAAVRTRMGGSPQTAPATAPVR